MKINELNRNEIFRSLVTSEQGLSADEAHRRLAEFGLNTIQTIRRKPLALRFLSQFTHFLAILLWLAAGLSFVSEWMNPGEGMLTLGFAIIAVIVINALFTFIQEYRAEKALEALKQLLPFHVTVLREGKEEQIPAEQVVPGDIVRLAEGYKVPADLRLIDAVGLRVNNASLTGESDPVLCTTEPTSGDPINSSNIAFAGTVVVAGSGTGVAYATGMRTEFGRIAHLTGTVTPGLSPLQKEIIRVTRIIAAIAVVMGAIFFAAGHFIGRSFWQNFLFAVGIIVANVPEGLLPTVTLALAMGSQRMARQKALMKTLTSVETLGSVSVICTDKTGTLTQNRMSVAMLWVDGEFIENPAVCTTGTRQLLLTTAVLCNNSRMINGEVRGDPTETALLKTGSAVLGRIDAERIHEIPFDADRKMMTTVHRRGNAVTAFSKGALEKILPLCANIAIKGERLALDNERRSDIVKAYHALMDQGLRVLAFAVKELYPHDNLPSDVLLEQEMTFIGLIGLQDPPRPDVPAAIEKCRIAGIRIIMITGDGSRTAIAIARKIGLVKDNPLVIEGETFAKLSDSQLLERLAAPEIIFSRMTPKHKMRVVSLLKEMGEIVAVTGDGVNDAPALKRADIGIAMGITGTDVAKEAADMILLDDNFATIVNAVEEGRAVYENIKKFISYIFASNIPEIVPYLAYILLRIPLPLTIMQILAVDLGTDMLPALALGAEKPTPGVMHQPPRKPTERLLTFSIMARSYLFLGPIEAAACMFGFFLVLFEGGWSWGTMLLSSDILYRQATTACLTAIIVTQIANVFACRSFRESLCTIGFTTNKLIFLGIALELLLQFFIVYHPLGNAVFGTAAINAEVWFMLIPFAVFLLFAEETRKFFVRFQSNQKKFIAHVL